MLHAGTGYSRNISAEKAAELACRSALKKLGTSKADTVLFFTTVSYRESYPAIIKRIRELTGASSVVGTSGYGVLTEKGEIERQPGLCVLAINSDHLQTHSFLVPNLQENNFAAAEQVGLSLRLSGIDPRLVLLFPDAFSFQSHTFFDGFEQGYGYVPLIGGASAEHSRKEKSYQFEGDRVAYDAVSGLALGGNFRFETGLTRSCKPFGEPIRITRSEGNVIYEIDGRPAYDILLEHLSIIHLEDSQDLFQQIFLGTPVRNYQTNFTDSSYLIRNIMSVNAKKGIFSCVAPVEEGEFITFTLRDSFIAREDMSAMLDDLKLRTSGEKAAFGIYINCCTRGKMLYSEASADVSLIRQSFPDLPLAGFFSFGEIAPMDHVDHLHQHSGILTLFMENP